MKKYICDHCGKEIKDGVMSIEIRINEVHMEKHELCRDCTDDFITWTKEYFELAYGGKR